MLCAVAHRQTCDFRLGSKINLAYRVLMDVFCTIQEERGNSFENRKRTKIVLEMWDPKKKQKCSKSDDISLFVDDVVILVNEYLEGCQNWLLLVASLPCKSQIGHSDELML